MSPFFSIIIPTFNRATVLKQSVDSVLFQTFTDFELIIVDDGSVDNTDKIVTSIKDSRVVYIKNTRTKGACGARNTGAIKAKGKWLAFLDSDDTWECDKLKKMHERLRYMEKGACYSGYFRFRNGIKESIVDGVSGDHLKDLYYSNIVRGLSLFVVDKFSFWKISGFDESFRSKQDLDLYIRLAKLFPFEYIKEPLVTFNPYSNNRITLDLSARLEGYLAFHDKYWKEVPYEAKERHLKLLIHYSFQKKNYSRAIKFFMEWLKIKFFKYSG
ncbi:glycosyltransferase family 2 protein [Echinicola soli]|uniref:Glycosyltransferase family 2 protein n=1 Tax=Echinicola soli TaxID=2591634 RepID=A0A514CJ06_9BACT|nr:glycosyltransferase family 2 protein [Echinicola soli]QDH79807.1 glycosyltransferase family 2 protein [Echinicola soli]